MRNRKLLHVAAGRGLRDDGNYLKFLEEARTEYLEDRGMFLKELMEEGVWFVVRRQEIEYKSSARYGDELEIKTWIKEFSNVRIQFEYEIKNQDGLFLTKAVTDMVCVGKDLKLKEMPDKLKMVLKKGIVS